jgi:hypothetical protein
MSKVASPSMAPPTPTAKVYHEKIAMRAYEKWVRRGKNHGCDLQDWLEAEKELQAEMAKAPAMGNRR